MMSSADPCHFVIFGATGHLSTTQLLPALYQLDAAGRLGGELRFIVFARRDWNDERWRQHVERVVQERLGERYDRAAGERFARRFDYVRGDLHDPASYDRLLQAAGARPGGCENVVFYLAIKPEDFDEVVVNLHRAGVGRARGRYRVVVEKPFGVDLESARRLNRLLHERFDEEQIYRIDHFLGKETVQNLFVFRFANTLIEPIWNRHHIDHVQITVAESGGIDGRADYYDSSGALRDMVQNHLLQLLTVVAMEPPARFEADALADEKAKVLRSMRPIAPDQVEASAVRGQYTGASPRGSYLRGYREEPRVSADSATETFAALRFHIDNWRWRDVPFFLRTGKRLPLKRSLIAIRFRRPPQQLFEAACGESLDPNWILISIQPEEGLHIELHAKHPGLEFGARKLRLDASYRAEAGAPVEAYQTLLLDAIEGDRSLFLRFDEVEWAWRVIDPVLRRWTEHAEPLAPYPAGSWGPSEADRLFERPGRHWRNDP